MQTDSRFLSALDAVVSATTLLKFETVVPLGRAGVPSSFKDWTGQDRGQAAYFLGGAIKQRVMITRSGLVLAGGANGANIGHIALRRGNPVAILRSMELANLVDMDVPPEPEQPANAAPEQQAYIAAARGWLRKTAYPMPRLKTTDPQTMAATAINKELDQLRDMGRKVNDAFLEAGRGSERPSEWMRIEGDPLVDAAKAVESRKQALLDEVQARMGPGYYSIDTSRRGHFGPRRKVEQAARAWLRKDAGWSKSPLALDTYQAEAPVAATHGRGEIERGTHLFGYYSPLRPLGSWAKMPDDAVYTNGQRTVWLNDALAPERILALELVPLGIGKARARYIRAYHEDRFGPDAKSTIVMASGRPGYGEEHGTLIHPNTGPEDENDPRDSGAYHFQSTRWSRGSGFTGHDMHGGMDEAVETARRTHNMPMDPKDFDDLVASSEWDDQLQHDDDDEAKTARAWLRKAILWNSENGSEPMESSDLLEQGGSVLVDLKDRNVHVAPSGDVHEALARRLADAGHWLPRSVKIQALAPGDMPGVEGPVLTILGAYRFTGVEGEGAAPLTAGDVRQAARILQLSGIPGDTAVDVPAFALEGVPLSGLIQRVFAAKEVKTARAWLTKASQYVADEAGQPKTFYHGTSRQFDSFNPKPKYKRQMQLGFGTHFAEDPQFAQTYATGKQGRVVQARIKADKVLEDDQIVYEGTPEYEFAQALYRGTPYAKLLMGKKENEDGSGRTFGVLQLDRVSPAKAEAALRQFGYDAVRYKAQLAGGAHALGTKSPQGASSSSLVVLDPPSQIETDKAASAWLNDLGKGTWGGKPYSQEAADRRERVLGMAGKYGEGHVATVPIADLAALQPDNDLWFDEAKVQRFVAEGNHPPALDPDRPSFAYPKVDLIDGQYYVVDGHHRIEAARRRGDTTVEVWLHELTPDRKLAKFHQPRDVVTLPKGAIVGGHPLRFPAKAMLISPEGDGWSARVTVNGHDYVEHLRGDDLRQFAQGEVAKAAGGYVTGPIQLLSGPHETTVPATPLRKTVAMIEDGTYADDKPQAAHYRFFTEQELREAGRKIALQPWRSRDSEITIDRATVKAVLAKDSETVTVRLRKGKDLSLSGAEAVSFGLWWTAGDGDHPVETVKLAELAGLRKRDGSNWRWIDAAGGGYERREGDYAAHALPEDSDSGWRTAGWRVSITNLAGQEVDGRGGFTGINDAQVWADFQLRRLNGKPEPGDVYPVTRIATPEGMLALNKADFLPDQHLHDALGFAPLVLGQGGWVELAKADGGLDVVLKWEDGAVRSKHALTWAKGLDLAKAGRYYLPDPGTHPETPFLDLKRPHKQTAVPQAQVKVVTAEPNGLYNGKHTAQVLVPLEYTEVGGDGERIKAPYQMAISYEVKSGQVSSIVPYDLEAVRHIIDADMLLIAWPTTRELEKALLAYLKPDKQSVAKAAPLAPVTTATPVMPPAGQTAAGPSWQATAQAFNAATITGLEALFPLLHPQGVPSPEAAAIAQALWANAKSAWGKQALAQLAQALASGDNLTAAQIATQLIGQLNRPAPAAPASKLAKVGVFATSDDDAPQGVGVEALMRGSIGVIDPQKNRVYIADLDENHIDVLNRVQAARIRMPMGIKIIVNPHDKSDPATIWLGTSFTDPEDDQPLTAAQVRQSARALLASGVPGDTSVNVLAFGLNSVPLKDVASRVNTAHEIKTARAWLTKATDDEVDPRETGVFIGLDIPDDVASKLVQAVADVLPEGVTGEPAEKLHVTLVYLGKEDKAGDSGDIEDALEAFARQHAPLDCRIGGMGLFEQDDQRVFYAQFDCPGLQELRADLVQALQDNETGVPGDIPVPDQEQYGYTAHVTLAYLPADAKTPDVKLPTEAFKVATLDLWWGETRKKYKLGGKGKAPADGNKESDND